MASSDDIKSDDEHLQDASRNLAAVRRANRIGRYAFIGAAVLTGVYIFGVLGQTNEWVWEYAIPMLGLCAGAAIVAQRLALMILFRAEGLGKLPLLDEAAPTADKNAEFPASVEVPRLADLPLVDELGVLTAELRRGQHSVFTATAGRAENKIEKLPLGLIILTTNGIAFLPDARPEVSDMLKDAKGIAWEIAKDAFKVIGVLSALGIGERGETPEALPTWIAAARAHPDHFAIPWGELVAASYTPGVVRLVRERDVGKRETYQWTNHDSHWPALLMEHRIHHEVVSLGRKLVLQPRAEELAPALYEQFRAIYGERIGEHSDEILAELNRRTTASFTPGSTSELSATVKPAMAPVLSAYAKLPRVVRNNSWLFTDTAKT